MVFALLIAAIIWNFGTWYLGIPNSSSHSLIGSIIGVGLMNQIVVGPAAAPAASTGARRVGVIKSLLFSPLVGFVLAAAVAAAREVADQDPGALQGARGQSAAAVVDSRPADPDLHRGQLCARLE